MEYTKLILPHICDPLTSDQLDFSYKTFSDESDKPASYLEKLWKSVESKDHVITRGFAFNSFLKDESYDFKSRAQFHTALPRCIQGPTDEFKAVSLPAIHQIDAQVFKNPRFVKRIPVTERFAYVRQKLEGFDCGINDYTSFECHPSGGRERILGLFFDHMFSNHPEHPVLEILKTVAIGTNTCKFKTCTATVKHRLMSGLPWTSTVSAVQNFIYTTFAATFGAEPEEEEEQKDGKARGQRAFAETVEDQVKRALKMKIFIEGDDSIFAMEELFNDKAKMDDVLQRIGCIAKIQIVDNNNKPLKINTASFCGLLMSDSDALITDPIKIICNFFTIPLQYCSSKITKQRGLMKAKAMSYYYQFPACPMVSYLSWAVISRYPSYSCDFTTLDYGRKQLAEEKDFKKYNFRQKPVIDDKTYLMVEEIFGIDISYQKAFEQCCVGYSKGEDPIFPSHPSLFDYQLVGHLLLGNASGRDVDLLKSRPDYDQLIATSRIYVPTGRPQKKKASVVRATLAFT